jgi:hypothetical protein
LHLIFGRFKLKKQKPKKIPAVAVWHGVKGLPPCRLAAGS